ncbi:MAG: peptidase T [Sphaerochaetaceae bacterium]|nr:peptidase T [Sphaerochaetaceae bacterium]
MIDFKESVKKRFIRYTQFDTMSDDGLVGRTRPTTSGQLVLLKELKKELEELGLETYLGSESVLMGVLKGNTTCQTIGFMAHVDTANDVMGNNVKAQCHIYKGGDIELNNGTVIKVCENKDLLMYLDDEIITSDGTTLLGSDDKAGVAEIMEALVYLKNHPEIKHGDIEVFFTPDEETGSGMDLFPFDKKKSICCYTIDGGREGEIESECFNAASIEVVVHGVSTHLGSGRGKLVNAITVASHLVTALPQAESPEATDGRYGYYCALGFEGNQTEARVQIFIRDFDTDNFFRRIENVEKIARSIEALYHAKIDVNSSVTYRNMAVANSKLPEATRSIMEAGKRLGLELYEEIIRGGTDGARLAESGTPCPNIFTGGHNLHSLEEWVGVPTMSKSVNLIIEIAKWWAEQ